MTFKDQLRDILSNEKLKERLNEARRRVLALCRTPEQWWTGKDHAEVEAGRLHPAESRDVSLSARVNSSAYEGVLKDLVIDQIGSPSPIAVSELAEAFRQHLLVRDEEFETGYAVFRGKVLESVDENRWSECWPIAAEISLSGLIREGIAEGADDVIWETAEISVCLRDSVDPEIALPETPAAHHKLPVKIVYVYIVGTGTPGAFQALAQHFRQVMPSAVRSSAMLSSPLAVLTGFAGWEEQMGDPRLPILYPQADLSEQSTFFRECVTFSLARPSRNDSTDRRIRNAVLLLVEADRQASDALGLAMSCAAMEALVCRKNEPVTRTLSESAAVLLEPDPKYRPDAVKLISDLYGKRSDALHGRKLETESDDRLRGRLLAAGLLKAVIDRRACMARMGHDPESPEAFLAELRHLVLSGGEEVVGVSSSPICRLWRGS